MRSLLAAALLLLPGGLLAQGAAVQLETGGKEFLGRADGFEIVLAPAPAPAPASTPAGTGDHLAVLVDLEDRTDLFERTPKGLRYRAGRVSLPRGTSTLSVWSVSPQGEWRELGKATLRVLLPGGLEKVQVTPKLDVGLKGQLAQGQSPEGSVPGRTTFQELNGQADLVVSASRGPRSAEARMNVVGVTNQPEALRFSTAGTSAPRVDLSTWSLRLGLGPATFTAGALTFGQNRHLIRSFGSRGIGAALKLWKGAEASVGYMNGTPIVGWDNFLGISNSSHRILAGQLSAELVPSRPGTLKVEATALDGSLQPVVPFNGQLVNDAEKSRGLGVRVSGSFLAQRVRIEGGLSRSSFTNPSDPTLAQGQAVIAVRETTRNARYLELGVDVLRAVPLSPTLPLTITIQGRHERVDPLYRSVAAPLQADLEQNGADLNVQLGPVSAQAGFGSTEDNLADLPSALRTQGRRANAAVSLPLGALFASPGKAPSPFLPVLTWAWVRQHQYGSAPPAGNFPDSFIPDQLNASNTAGLSWQIGRFRAGYRLAYADQDNRQVGRESADFLNSGNGISLGVSAASNLDLGLDLGEDRSVNEERARTDRTRRFAGNVSWRPHPRFAVTSAGSVTKIFDDAGTSESLNRLVDVSASWRIEWKGPVHGVTGQLSLRWAWQDAHSFDTTFGTKTDRKSWAVSSGLNLSLF